jgi:hypothetical protein
MDIPMVVLNTLIGVSLLTLGRKLFWLFVGSMGFTAGLAYGNQLWGAQSDLVILAMSLLMGLAGALIAIFLQGLAVGVGGFVAGGYIGVTILNLCGIATGGFSWLAYAVSGVVGAVLLVLVFDWALIVLSSLTGAALIVQGNRSGTALEIGLFIALTVLGILFQGRMVRKE